ncbi:MAG: hypothetical protein ACYTKD_22630 [Planctomycetota bacterium]|jgi:hypothetical protein
MFANLSGEASRLRWFLPLALALTAGTAHGAGLWTDGDLLAWPALEAGDTVTVVLEEAPPSAAAATRAAVAVAPSIPRELAARVVKALPNGNLVLEARVSVGEGYVLLGGEVARADVDARRRTDVSRLARLAVVARGLDPRALGAVIGAAAK